MSNTRIELLKKVDVSKPAADKNYQQMIVTHTDLVNGNTDGKKLFDFTAKAVWGTLLAANPGDVFEVERKKNEKGYWEWIGISASTKAATDAAPQTATSPTTSAARPANAVGKATERVGSWETPEERALKQVYIVRQSSIANAIALLAVEGPGITPDVEWVIATAKTFENYVFDGVATLTNDQPE